MRPPSHLDIAEIAREHYQSVFRFCARRIGVDRAPDVAQETFLTAQKALPRYRGESSISTWLFGIAHNECRRAMRRGRNEPLLLDVEPGALTQEGTESAVVNRELLRVALMRLSDEHREVVVMHELEGMTYEEIAVILGVPVGTIKSRLHHAFLNMRKALGATQDASTARRSEGVT